MADNSKVSANSVSQTMQKELSMGTGKLIGMLKQSVDKGKELKAIINGEESNR